MITPDRREFDRSFALAYPEYRGLSETIESGERVISELEPASVELYNQLVNADFPVLPKLIEGENTTYLVPEGARDLTSYIRLVRAENANALGRVVGWRLGQLFHLTRSAPQDGIINRFAVVPKATEAYGEVEGVDIVLLPPYDRFSRANSLDHMISTVVAETLEITLEPTDAVSNFEEGMYSGSQTIG